MPVDGKSVLDLVVFGRLGIFVEHMKITPETLEQNGWTESSDPNLPWRSWSKEVGRFFLDLDNVSNMTGRGWSLHVDNWCRDSVASLDVDTFEHIDGLLRLLED